METIATLFPDNPRSAIAQERLRSAYEAVFGGFGGLEDAQIVASDLAAFTGFFNVNPPGASTNELYFSEGQRSVFGRILSYVNLPAPARAQLLEAVRVELAATENNEGVSL